MSCVEDWLLSLVDVQLKKLFTQVVSTGALDDIRRATDIAYKAITESGLNQTIGPVWQHLLLVGLMSLRELLHREGIRLLLFKTWTKLLKMKNEGLGNDLFLKDCSGLLHQHLYYFVLLVN